MGKLLKYEFRKTMFSKLVLLAITGLVEVLYLAGVFLKWDKGLMIGIIGLVLCASIGIFYIGIDSLLVYHRDLNTKQSYMLFLTPKNSYKILGAKIIENGISLSLAGLFYAALAAIDFSTAVLYIGGLEEFLDLLHEMMISINIEINISAGEMLLTLFAVLASWLMMIVTGYLAILLSASVLAGKKFSGFVSFILYMVLSWITNWVLNLIPSMNNLNLQMALIIVGALILSAGMYVISGWIMERKLSV